MINTPVEYYPNFLADVNLNPEHSFQLLSSELDWQRRDTTPRSEYYCNDFPFPYQYGRGRGVRLYEPQPWHTEISRIRDALQLFTNIKFDTCFLNQYLSARDHLGWHSDDSPEMDPNRPIGVISLGSVREIWFRPISDGSERAVEKLTLSPGSLLLMSAGMQQIYQHRIPKASSESSARISLTFRGYLLPTI